MIGLAHDELLRRLSDEGCEPQLAGPPPRSPFATVAWDDRTKPGGRDALFVAIRGDRHDSHRSVPTLEERGFAGFIGEQPAPTGLIAPYYQVRDARRALAVLCQAFAGDPATGLELFGITGTNGKSTTVRILASILAAVEPGCGWMSTVNTNLGEADSASEMTTPEPGAIASGLARFAAKGGRRFVLEVSSHALDQDRVAGLAFAGAALTNVTRDHFDYHGGPEAYLDAKLKLFERLGPGAPAVVPAESYLDLQHPRLRHAEARTGRPAVRFALPGAPTVGVDSWVESSRFDAAAGTVASLRVLGERLDVECSLVGRHNLTNVLVAATLAAAAGFEREDIRRGIAATPGVRGRLERVPAVAGDVFVDYAHTPDALRAVLTTARELTRGALSVVFGCGGDRDRGKRPEMGSVAAEFADRVIVTSDNPRTEEPVSIIDHVAVGLGSRAGEAAIEPDRASAIRLGLDELVDGDVLIVAGKGHETYQEIGTERFPFDDAEVIRRVFEERSRS